MNRTSSPWHTLTRKQSVEHLGTHLTDGLPAAEAATRLAQSGPNQLAEQPPRPLWLD